MQERLYSQDGLKVLFHHEKGNHKLKGDLKEMYINTVIFVLYRLFNKEDEETPAPVSEPPSTSSPANLLLQAADDMASAPIYESIGPG
ncbi:hypothetical protein ZWY2020_051786 [Hordeum vulgare]|nr:hypothetical protein ZWY2020_051786 [Hordeum vulgare]